ncbi:MAG: IPT/TIG domain-containing protein [Candidatus Rifleibacteriota bacterium]
MKITGYGKKYLYFFVTLVLFGLFAGLQGCGGGSGSSPARVPPVGTVYGKVSSAEGVRLNIVGETSDNLVAKALVWLENYPDKTCLTDQNGEFALKDVPLNENHRIVCSYDLAASNELYLARSAPFQVSAAQPVKKLSELEVEKGLYSVNGYLTDNLGKPVANAELSLWGMKFYSNAAGYFNTPPLPPDAADEKITISAPGFREHSFEMPFLKSSNLSSTINLTLSDLSEPNYSPVVYFTEIPGKVSPEERVELEVAVFDPDEYKTDQFNPEWSSTVGEIESGADSMRIAWIAPTTTGMATISAEVTDSRGAKGSVNVAIAVGGDKNIVIRVDKVEPLAAETGETITIFGSGFGNSEDEVSLSFNGINAEIISCSDSQIVAKVPPGDADGIILIKNKHGEKSAGNFTLVDPGLSISPAYGPAGTLVHVKGRNFLDNQSESQILVNGVVAEVVSWSDTQIDFVVPRGANSGVVNLVINNKTRVAGIFKVNRVFNTDPLKTFKNDVITITGEGWGSAPGSSYLYFDEGGVKAPVISWSESKLLIRVPSGAKTGDLSAEVQGVNFKIASMTVNSIETITPQNCIAGDIVSISGHGFGSNPGSVTIGGDAAEVVSWSHTFIEAKILPGTRPGNLIVTADALDSNGVAINVMEITSISADRLPVGASLTINGYGFGKDTGYVLFGESTSTDFSIWRPDEIKVTIPQTATGTASVVVSNMGIRSKAVDFDILYFDKIDYETGWYGREITVSGAHLGDGSEQNKVLFNQLAAPILSWNDSEIHFRVPEGAASGPVSLVVNDYPTIVCSEFVVYPEYDYTQIYPSWSGPRANSAPFLPGVDQNEAGDIFITDYDNGWVWKISADGSQTKFANLDKPWGVAVNNTSELVYVAESGGHSLKAFDFSGNYVKQIAGSGNSDGQVYAPRGLAIDSQGMLYVADAGNSRIQIFDTSTDSYFNQLGSYGSGNGQFNAPSGIAIDSTFNLYVADANNHRIQRFAPNDVTSPSSWSFSGWLGSKDPNIVTPGWLTTGFGQASTRDGEFYRPFGVAVSENSELLVADTYNNRVQVIDLNAGTFLNKIGAAGITGGQYNQPVDLYSLNDNVMIADSSNSRLQKSSVAGAYIEQIEPDTSLLTTLPVRITVDSKNRKVFVLDREDGSITVFNLEGEVIQVIGSKGAGDNQFYNPEGLAVDNRGYLFVADTGNARVQVISPEGAFIKNWGVYGSGDGQFFKPSSITVDNSGTYLFVADREKNRIQKFDTDGTFIKDWGATGISDDGFNYPAGLAINEDGFCYVVDRGNHRIKKYDTDGNFVGWWGSYDAGSLAFWLDPGSNRTGAFSDSNGAFDTPTDVALDAQGNVYVADTGNFRMQRFSAEQKYKDAAGFQTEIYVGENIAALTVDDWGRVYAVSADSNKILRFVPDP